MNVNQIPNHDINHGYIHAQGATANDGIGGDFEKASNGEIVANEVVNRFLRAESGEIDNQRMKEFIPQISFMMNAIESPRECIIFNDVIREKLGDRKTEFDAIYDAEMQKQHGNNRWEFVGLRFGELAYSELEKEGLEIFTTKSNRNGTDYEFNFLPNKQGENVDTYMQRMESTIVDFVSAVKQSGGDNANSIIIMQRHFNLIAQRLDKLPCLAKMELTIDGARQEEFNSLGTFILDRLDLAIENIMSTVVSEEDAMNAPSENMLFARSEASNNMFSKAWDFFISLTGETIIDPNDWDD